MFTPIVITSKLAQKDFDKIKSAHSDLLKGLAIQSEKVAIHKQQKQTELQAQNIMKAEMDKEKIIADTQSKKDAMTFAQKQSEIDLKRAALSAT